MSIFLQIPAERIIYKDEFFFIIRDKYPVSDGHSLIISNEVRSDYFDLTPTEKNHLVQVIETCKRLIEQEYQPIGYNIGMNCGKRPARQLCTSIATLYPAIREIWQTPGVASDTVWQGKDIIESTT